MSPRPVFDIQQERIQKALSMQEPFRGREALEHQLKSAGIEAENVSKAFALLESSSFINHEANYIAHPVRVAQYCLRYAADVSTDEIVLALIHNILEVTKIQVAEIEKQFGAGVSRSCQTLTIDRKRQHDKTYVAEYYSKISDSDPGVQRVKIFDKLDNLLVLFVNPNESVRQEYLKEIQEHLLPLVRKQLPALVPAFEKLIQENLKMQHITLAQFMDTTRAPR